MTPEAAFAGALAFFLDGQDGNTLGVAVSGGGDSMALLMLADEWGREHNIKIAAATVDHGLREDAAAEAADVAAFCAARAIAHHTIKWTGWNGQGNLQAAARDARRKLLHEWAQAQGIQKVLLGHTADDQAETFLMALARGSGVDGLCGMSAQTILVFVRPLLDVRRSALRDLLRARAIDWVDDPSNEDVRFDRIKARQMMVHLDALGLSVDRIVQTAAHMNRAKVSLGQRAAEYARDHIRSDGPDLLFPAMALAIGDDDTRTRVFCEAIRWIGANTYRPRFAALIDAASAVRAGQQRTLNGVLIQPDGAGGARLTREPAAATDVIVSQGGEASLVWDGRWCISPLHKAEAVWPANITIKALGADLSRVKNWRSVGLPRATWLGSPALYQDDTLIAALGGGVAAGYAVQIRPDFITSLLTH